MNESIDMAEGLTVVIPVYNRASMVGETLDSLEAQTRRPEKLILVDNGSTDNTPEVLAKSADRLRGLGWDVTVVGEPRKGAARARQTGFEHVSTEYVMFFDSDDWMPEGHIDYVYNQLVGPGDLDLLCWNIRFLSPDGRESTRRILPESPLMNHFVQGLLSTQAYAVRSEFLRRAGGWNPRIGGWDDYELGVRLLMANPRMRVDPAPRVDVRQHAASITGDGYAHRAGDWEKTLDEIEHNIKLSSHPERKKMLRLLAYRRAVLAAHYHREGRDNLASALMNKALGAESLRRRDKWLLRTVRLYTGSGLPWGGAIFPPLLCR